MRKKVLALALLLLLALPLALAGCNDKAVWTPGNGTLVDLSAMPDGTAEQYRYLYDQHPVATDDEYFGLYGGREYQGHPDSVLLDNGNILVAFPKSHGRAETIMMLSTDGGLTYTDIFNADNPKPDSFYHTEETPTIYKLDFTDGTQKLITISGRPSWPDVGNLGEGWDASVSTSLDENGKCDGLEWSEHENFYGPNAVREEYKRKAGAEKYDAVVAMSALVQLKENGKFVDKWMGLYHDDRTFTVYKTILTFNEEGQMEWSEPERMLGRNGKWREYEEIGYTRWFKGEVVHTGGNSFCETEIIRSPDGNELAALFRVNCKSNYSFVSFSTDEGETWSEPQTVAPELTGERHKAEYDPVTGKLVITMRNISAGEDGLLASNHFRSRGWVAWIGDYEDLKHGADGKGDMLVKLAHTYSTDGTEITEYANADTGYAGLVVLADGTVVTTSYGTFSPVDSELGGKTYVMTKQFKIADLAAMAGVTLR